MQQIQTKQNCLVLWRKIGLNAWTVASLEVARLLSRFWHRRTKLVGAYQRLQSSQTNCVYHDVKRHKNTGYFEPIMGSSWIIYAQRDAGTPHTNERTMHNAPNKQDRIMFWHTCFSLQPRPASGHRDASDIIFQKPALKRAITVTMPRQCDKRDSYRQYKKD